MSLTDENKMQVIQHSFTLIGAGISNYHIMLAQCYKIKIQAKKLGISTKNFPTSEAKTSINNIQNSFNQLFEQIISTLTANNDEQEKQELFLSVPFQNLYAIKEFFGIAFGNYSQSARSQNHPNLLTNPCIKKNSLRDSILKKYADEVDKWRFILNPPVEDLAKYLPSTPLNSPQLKTFFNNNETSQSPTLNNSPTTAQLQKRQRSNSIAENNNNDSTIPNKKQKIEEETEETIETIEMSGVTEPTKPITPRRPLMRALTVTLTSPQIINNNDSIKKEMSEATETAKPTTPKAPLSNNNSNNENAIAAELTPEKKNIHIKIGGQDIKLRKSSLFPQYASNIAPLSSNAPPPPPPPPPRGVFIVPPVKLTCPIESINIMLDTENNRKKAEKTPLTFSQLNIYVKGDSIKYVTTETKEVEIASLLTDTPKEAIQNNVNTLITKESHPDFFEAITTLHMKIKDQNKRDPSEEENTKKKPTKLGDLSFLAAAGRNNLRKTGINRAQNEATKQPHKQSAEQNNEMNNNNNQHTTQNNNNNQPTQ